MERRGEERIGKIYLLSLKGDRMVWTEATIRSGRGASALTANDVNVTRTVSLKKSMIIHRGLDCIKVHHDSPVCTEKWHLLHLQYSTNIKFKPT